MGEGRFTQVRCWRVAGGGWRGGGGGAGGAGGVRDGG